MNSNRKLNTVKRIAFVASDNNRKSLIEWSYYNQEILKQHELIAAGPMADILEGTIGVPVTRLPEGSSSANHHLAAMITDQKIDILLFFWDPIQSMSPESSLGALHDIALNRNVIIIPNQATADFVLSSALMGKTHSVPVPDAYAAKASGYFNNHEARRLYEPRRVVLKVNTIN